MWTKSEIDQSYCFWSLHSNSNKIDLPEMAYTHVQIHPMVAPDEFPFCELILASVLNLWH